jgi:hypothetical protein
MTGDFIYDHKNFVIQAMDVRCFINIGSLAVGFHSTDLNLQGGWLFIRRHDTQQNDIQHNGIQQNDIQNNDFQHNDIQQNDIQDNDIKHNDTQHKGLIYDAHHTRQLAYMTLSIKDFANTLTVEMTSVPFDLLLC